MKFNKWSMKRIREGKKTLTSRRTRHEGDPHVKGIVGPLTWGYIKRFLYRLEGAESPAELQSVMNQLSRRKVSDDTEFHVHTIDVEKVLEDNPLIITADASKLNEFFEENPPNGKKTKVFVADESVIVRTLGEDDSE